jgi:predicted esterase
MEHQVSFEYTARYFKSADITAQTKQIVFVLHGYGQLAKYFLKKFAVLASESICVIAPEGLARFYVENFEPGKGRTNDRVGATWMTKEDRLLDIKNYLGYLQTVYLRETSGQNIPVTVLGFSQGSATASRWVLNNPDQFQRLILWSGIFPPDMDLETGREILKGKEVIWVYGNKDPFLSDKRHHEMRSIALQFDANVTEVVFEGGHDIDEETLLKII